MREHIRKPRISLGSSGLRFPIFSRVYGVHSVVADSDEAARVNRNDAAQDSEMMSPVVSAAIC
jgi:hypothetical protein